MWVVGHCMLHSIIIVILGWWVQWGVIIYTFLCGNINGHINYPAKGKSSLNPHTHSATHTYYSVEYRPHREQFPVRWLLVHLPHTIPKHNISIIIIFFIGMILVQILLLLLLLHKYYYYYHPHDYYNNYSNATGPTFPIQSLVSRCICLDRLAVVPCRGFAVAVHESRQQTGPH